MSAWPRSQPIKAVATATPSTALTKPADRGTSRSRRPGSLITSIVAPPGLPRPEGGRPRTLGVAGLAHEVVGDVDDGRVGAEEERPFQAERRLVVQWPLPPVARHVLRQDHRDRGSRVPL